jgi:hypothetical protein
MIRWNGGVLVDEDMDAAIANYGSVLGKVTGTDNTVVMSKVVLPMWLDVEHMDLWLKFHGDGWLLPEPLEFKIYETETFKIGDEMD